MTGKILGKRYELLERVDSGGMADIYKALCKKTNSIVAIKMLMELALYNFGFDPIPAKR